MSLFIGIYKAIFDYEAQNEEELSLVENDLLYLLETSDVDDWWKVKKRVVGSEAEEPAGLVPSNYIEVAPVISNAVALFDYDKQTDEELSFKEGDSFDVYDTSDQDWILVGLNQSQFGFVPANYIEIGGSASSAAPSAPTNYGASQNAASFLPPPQRYDQKSREATPVATSNPIATSPGPAVPSKENGSGSAQYGGFEPQASSTAAPVLSYQNHNNNDVEDAPPMPSRPRSSQAASADEDYDYDHHSAAPEDFVKDDFFTWPVQEITSKGKKIKNTLGVGNAMIYISPDASTGGTPRQWKAEHLLNFSNEKKHVFLEFEKPYTNIELHAGSKDSAEAIVSILGDIKGAISMKGLQEVKAASIPSKANGHRTGKIIFDFEAATDDELTVKENDIVIILNDKKSKDWWMVENVDTGEQGVIPSNYVEPTKSLRKSSSSNILAKVSQRVANPNKKKRREKEKEKLRAEHAQREKDLDYEQKERRRSRRERELRDREERERIRKYDERERAKHEKRSSSYSEKDKAKPNPHRARTWIDRSGSFKVEAEFLGCVDGKIHLHKTNGVKIAVAAPKLSTEDLEYVERITGMSLENYKPKPKARDEDIPPPQPVRPQQTGVVDVRKPISTANAKDPDYDWFEFFLNCGVDVNNCQRYQINFNREQMDENILEDISPSLLRTLGLREGDILRVMKYLDTKFDRKKQENGAPTNGGIFQGPNGNLSTDRLAAADRVDGSKLSPTKTSATTVNKSNNNNNQFEDDAWAVKPAAQTGFAMNISQDAPPRPSSVPTQQLNGSISDLINLKPVDSSTNRNATQSVPPKPAAPVLQPIKTGGGLAMEGQSYTPLNPQKTSGTLASQFTGGLLIAQPTGFVPIGNFIPTQMTGGFITAQPTGILSLQPTGAIPVQRTGLLPLQQTGFMPLQKTGGFTSQPTGNLIPLQRTGGLLPPQPTGAFSPQKTGTLGNAMPATSFGQSSVSTIPMQKTGGFVPQTSFGQMLVQKTGGNLAMPATSFSSQPTGGFQIQPAGNFNALPQKTGGGFIPSQPTNNNFSLPAATTFGGQPTGGLLNNPFPQTSFGQQQQPFATQPTFGGNGFAQQPTFGNGISQQPQQTGLFNQAPQQTGLFNQQPQPQQNFNLNNLSNMFQNTSISPPPAQQQQQPFTSFGQAPQPQFGGFPMADQPLQSQPTGFGFGNGSGGLQPQKTGRANLANATADNPFGF